MNAPFIHAGMVLAAGASARMGQPKALLPTPAGIPLARHQCELLRKAGCRDVVVVLGCDHDRIKSQLGECPIAFNKDWVRGRFGSIQTGLKALPDFSGCLILPVDTVGVAADTLRSVLSFAEQRNPPAVRPVSGDKVGKIAWISKVFADELLRMPPSDIRLDQILQEKAVRFHVSDPAIVNNVNTLEEWGAARRQLQASTTPET